jgi:hypothetical protein
MILPTNHFPSEDIVPRESDAGMRDLLCNRHDRVASTRADTHPMRRETLDLVRPPPGGDFSLVSLLRSACRPIWLVALFFCEKLGKARADSTVS